MFGASKLEVEIMSLLKNGSRLYGLEMVKASSLLKRGSIYVYLGRMEEKEWIKSEAEKDPSVAGMPRRRYWITGKGQAVLNRAVATAAEYASWSPEGGFAG